jgi:hypothetical protein
VGEALDPADRILAEALGWKTRTVQGTYFDTGERFDSVMHHRADWPGEGDYSWAPWPEEERFTMSMDALCAHVVPLLDSRGSDWSLGTLGKGRFFCTVWSREGQPFDAQGATPASALAAASALAVAELALLATSQDHRCDQCDGDEWTVACPCRRGQGDLCCHEMGWRKRIIQDQPR